MHVNCKRASSVCQLRFQKRENDPLAAGSPCTVSSLRSLSKLGRSYRSQIEGYVSIFFLAVSFTLYLITPYVPPSLSVSLLLFSRVFLKIVLNLNIVI
eukprot:sb/3478871/